MIGASYHVESKKKKRKKSKDCCAKANQTLNIRLSSLYLVARRYPVDDVFQVADHRLLPEVGGKRLRPLRQQLQDFGAKFANTGLPSRGNTPVKGCVQTAAESDSNQIPSEIQCFCYIQTAD